MTFFSLLKKLVQLPFGQQKLIIGNNSENCFGNWEINSKKKYPIIKCNKKNNLIKIDQIFNKMNKMALMLHNKGSVYTNWYQFFQFEKKMFRNVCLKKHSHRFKHCF